jgi:predicted nuclease of predicted toxin-antitoxin system
MAAFQRVAVLLTEDKGFGELVTLRGQPSKGVILLRLNALQRQEAIVAALVAIEKLGEKLEGHVTVVQPGVIRSRAIGA